MGVAVQTGLTTEKIVFGSLPNIAFQMRCPRCKKVHKWKPKDAWVADESEG
jgi:rRNA maturation endonuclease Nob1